METSIAKTTLEKNLLLNIDMLECIRRGSAEIIFSSDYGVLLRDNISNIHMIYSENIETFNNIIYKIPTGIDMLVVHQEEFVDVLMRKFDFKNKMICHNVVYTNKNKIKVPRCKVNIILLTEEYKDIIIKNYSKIDISEEDYIYNRLKAKAIFGAFIDDKLCGFIGSHEEGSIGMLEVLPKYRGLGIAMALQAFATNYSLDNNRYAYGQVIEGNIASENLQKKLGFEFSKNKVYWLFK